MEYPDTLAQVIRVLRKDTILIRCVCPHIQSQVSMYMTPAELWCEENAVKGIIDWVECHADADRLKLITWDWMRDEYGRLLADLQDIQTGEMMTDYLVSVGAAKPRPHHYLDVIHTIAAAREPDEC